MRDLLKISKNLAKKFKTVKNVQILINSLLAVSKSKKKYIFRFLLVQFSNSIISAMKKDKPFKFGTVGKLFSRSIFLACQIFELGPESEIPAAENIVPE